MPKLVMWPLSKLLTRYGHSTFLFGYPSTGESLANNADRLAAFIRQFKTPVDLVGHSLGALVALEAISKLDASFSGGSFVALAPPFRGSAVGRKIADYRIGKMILGASKDIWGQIERSAPKGWRVGVICGEIPFGVATLVASLSSPNDGAVLRSESELSGASGSISIRTTHTGIIFSPTVAKLTSSFLKTGSFAADQN